MEYNLIIIYFLIINFLAFILMGIDKRRAIKHKWRIKEMTLFLYAIFGGALGGTVGMFLFRHKTQHLSFKVGFPILSLLWAFLIIYILTLS